MVFELCFVILMTFSSLRKFTYVEQLLPLVLVRMRHLGHLSGWGLGCGRMTWNQPLGHAGFREDSPGLLDVCC